MNRVKSGLLIILFVLLPCLFTIFFPEAGKAMTGKELVEEAKKGIKTISVAEAYSMFGKTGVVFLDVREPDEFKAGHIPGALHIPRGLLESQVEQQVSDKDITIVVYCRSGNRSALAAATLMKIGYRETLNMGGGFREWQKAGYPAE